MDPIEIKYEEPKMESPSTEKRVEELFGQFRPVTTTPTWTPRTFKDGFAIDTGSARFFYYDFINGSWRSIGSAATYAGAVGASASGNTLPTGWSASYDVGAAAYTVTHNLGNSSYMVVPVSHAELGFIVNTQLVINANTFVVQWKTLAGASGAPSWVFSLTMMS